ncbi:nuclear factor of activated T cells 2 interacting protein [Homo sapiens]|uniref:NFATC2-interacting protein n=4 Tax=Homo sapiens TaxID=9606 RepID=NF2IP_HUMAN|nr:NFATC2-interacting protein isoform 1 [Homo sapiens]Q8NCF5.1 RecName: Full=NFATC2-interacting protein; AltName: Full=45 kDa NF-AT-interacting protein; Short=45 kDa NFAT-interacting protein; AltName: Full=Nuclear factor of activated T-cells, cytoplasmic 2-interacting protein [Homo sapiens]AAI01742.1 Nuclear factor of activated T-cells, cytoplasmic, calcineurin-dependent 2 interacting protein [Homo sapiens]AAI12183.1 Nuclear factor of activated T-cells, cytoplasmic, calcineurin-dependent 2 inter|eukprot:NP_116204.3 NFATC2-interacting protein [Homo sapiens]
MAEPVGKRGRWSGGSGAGRGGRGGWGGRGRRPRAQRSPSRGTLDVVSVDLVTDSDEEILEVATARGAADEVEVEPPEPPGPVASRDNSNSDSEGEDRRPAGPPREPVRRRRRLVLDPGEAPLVPVYSGKVKSSLRLIPDDLSLLKLYPPGDEEEAELADSSGLYHEGSPSPGSPWKTKLRTKDKEEKKKTEFLDLDNSPLSPPSPRTKSRTHTRALKKLSEVNKRLQDLRSCLSPKPPQGQEQQGQEDEVVLVEGPTLPETPRLFPLKIRCRADLVRLPLRMSEPLQSVVDHMATHLGVSPSRILLLFGETELSPTATPRTLKLGVADIIDCVVLTSSPEATETSQQLQLRVQGKEKHQTLEVSLSRDSPLKTLMSHYEEAMGLSGRKLSFFFDGTKLSGRELPADLGMESGDLIEVWG